MASAWLQRLLDDTTSILVPITCGVCGQGLNGAERDICLECLLSMPRTQVHKRASNRITERLARVMPGVRVASWFFYRRQGRYAKLIHDIKYRDQPSLGRRLGAVFAAEIVDDGFFDGVDVILPVPMHWRKQLLRGFNQSTEIARGVSKVTGIKVAGNLRAVRGHGTQTRRGATERMHNVRPELLSVHHPEQLAGRHVLIVDDVITTGATIEAAVRALVRDQPSVAAVSILSLAMTEND